MPLPARARGGDDAEAGTRGRRAGCEEVLSPRPRAEATASAVQPGSWKHFSRAAVVAAAERRSRRPPVGRAAGRPRRRPGGTGPVAAGLRRFTSSASGSWVTPQRA
ncbi:MAG: hypothetical protein U0790_11680 [Isosphaeraceae bacterium]